MSERKFYHLSDGSHLFSASSDIVVTDVIEFFLFFSVDGLSFGVEHGIGRDNSELFGLSSHYFELYGYEVASDD